MSTTRRQKKTSGPGWRPSRRFPADTLQSTTKIIPPKPFFAPETLTFFLCRFREGISLLHFVERSILKLLLSKLCAVLFALQNGPLLGGREKGKRSREKGRKKGGSKRGKKEKRTHENRSEQDFQEIFFKGHFPYNCQIRKQIHAM